ncbi:MAG: DegV family protein, partial [Christensenellales bacterium]
MIIITADSSNDLGKELIEKNDIKILPFNILLDDKEYLDGVSITSQMIIDNFNKNRTLPKTSAVSTETYKEFFATYLKNDDDRIIHFALSSQMSCSCENGIRAAEEFGGKVEIIDSKSLSTGIGLLILYACDLKKAGESFENIVKKVRARVPFVQASFVINKLTFLHKGGRCTSLQLLGANLFNIKPSIEVADGKMG